MDLTRTFLDLPPHFAPVFTEPTFRTFTPICSGWILSHRHRYITDIWVNRATGILSIGTMGHGVFQRDIRPGASCSSRILLVRDNVYDRAVEPSPFDLPDAEHPIVDAARPNFYKPDDTPGGRVYWWTSNDIRIAVPRGLEPRTCATSQRRSSR